MYQFIYPVIYRRTSWLLPHFGSCDESCCKHPYAGFCVGVSFIPVGRYQGVWLLSCQVRACLVLWETTGLPEWLHCVAFPPAVSEFLLLRVLLAFAVVSVLDFGHSNGYVVVSRRFGVYFSNDIRCGAPFSCAYLPSVYLLWAVQVFCPFLNWVVCFLIVEFYEFFVYYGYQSFIGIVFCKYFLPVWGLSSSSLDVVFHGPEFLIVMRSSHISCVFHGVCFCVVITMPKVISIFS